MSANLTNMSVSSSVNFIGDYAFAKNNNLKNIDVNNLNPNYCSLNGVLYNKEKTKLINYPAKKLDAYFIIPETVNLIQKWAFYNSTILTSVIIPNLVTSIPDETFYGCTNLTSVTIPNSITYIGYQAFYNCSNLSSITIPNSVTSIDDNALYSCSNLSAIHSQAAIPPTLIQRYQSGAKVFGLIDKSVCILYVPVGSKTAYLGAAQWKDFKNIVEVTTDVLSLIQDKINIKVKSNKIILNNIKPGVTVQIFTTDGKMIFQEKSINQTLDIVLPKNYIYIVKAGDYRAKVIL